MRDGKIVREQKVVHAVNDISFTIAEGEAFSLVGESGCGKSTAARTIIRLLTPTSGEIIYRGKDIAPLKDNELLPYRKKIQMIFQDPYSSLDPRQKVKDILMEPILFHKLAPNRKAAETRCYELMERVGLRPEQADRYPHQFSGDSASASALPGPWRLNRSLSSPMNRCQRWTFPFRHRS